MGNWTDIIGHYDAETLTYTALVGAEQSSPYTPTKSGRLKMIRVVVSAEAATTLTNGVIFRLSCTTFNPNMLKIAVDGGGIRTAPAIPNTVNDFLIDQPVQAGIPITVEGRNVVGSPVTVNILLIGFFEG